MSLQLSNNCNCGNAARYITVHGNGACGLCAMKVDSVRLADVPTLLALIRKIEHEPSSVWMVPESRRVFENLASMFRQVIGRKP